ncbi:MAG: PBSX family phage terminase large subunit [Oscillospiraceae bacterium]|nr:PBSX family phage terminase large subunit [Oscillospiraceae bacterium]
MEVIVKIPDKCLFLLNEKYRYKVLFGGRGSSKSASIGQALLIKSLEDKIRILCARQIQVSIKDSVKKLLEEWIERLELSKYFTITNEAIRSVTGSEFIFKGLQSNTTEIKSLQGIKYVWVEEAESVTEEAWDILIPTIREPESEIWISFNPNMKTDPTYDRFITNKPNNCISVEMNYMDNPWFPDVLREEMEACKQLNYPKYEHIWLGVPNAEAGNLIKMDKFQRYKNPPQAFDSVFICCDTAFSEKKSADDSAFMLMGVKGKDKYILDIYCKKVTFVDLCRDLKSFYLLAVDKYAQTSAFTGVYIENKASGISLIQQLRSEGIPVSEIYPTVHNAELKKDVVADKYTRFLEIESELDSGFVWLPESASWLPEFTVQCEGFKGGKQDTKDDGVDTLIYSLKIAKRNAASDWDAFRRAFS